MKKVFAVLLIMSLSVLTFAHEYWFEPDKFFLAPNEKTSIHLFVGDGLIKDREEREFQPEKTTSFQLFSVKETVDLKSSITDKASPIYSFSAEKSGNYLLAMERNWSYIKLESDKFEDYLREDGMEYIIAERAKLGESKNEGRERYSRFIKSLLHVGDKQDETFKKKVGLKLEIIPLENPYLKKVGDNLNLQVFFDGKPLSDKTIFASNRESGKQKLKTAKNGKVSIKINKNGLWLVHLVFMQRCQTECAEADWESFWGAFSFGVK